ncbi:MAG: molybdopterin-dependent oxidoreductase [Thaumarchaeota archaeon]|nr:molybdopterin-dependent oxidoreductase [Nitrososphaerota archaeon]
MTAELWKSISSEENIVRSACSLCQNFCGLLAHKVDGRVVKLEGDPDNPRNNGHLCAKGLSGFLSLNSPRRVTSPMIRTSPAKGIGVDPKWKKIGWDEAIDMVVERLKKIRSNPKGYLHKVLFVTFDHWSSQFGALTGWLNAMQAFHGALGAPCFCGNAVHPPSYLNTATFEITPDAEYARYMLLIGAQAGSIIHYDTMNVARNIAQKRPNEVKVVVVDPVCSHAASRAEEWIPIRPGTDAAFILSIVNLLINEHGVYDADFLKRRTNAPYLIGKDKLYTRDRATNKPLVWDTTDRRAKPFDDPAVKDFALEGDYVVDDEPCRPAFQIVKDYVKNYSPEKVSEITTIPAETTRRISKELAEAACIGQTITIQGKKLPYRPVSVVWYRGLSAHKHSFLSGLAAMMIPTLLGAIQVPGGIKGHPHAAEYVTEDGLMAAKIPSSRLSTSGPPYPPRPVTKPKRMDLFELFPVAVYSRPLVIPVLLDPKRFGVDEDVRPDLAFIWRDNAMVNTYSPELVLEAFKKIPFIVAFAVEPDETTNLADLVFPDLHQLERLAESMYFRVDEPGYWYAAKPVVRPPFDPPYDKLLSIDHLLFEVAKKSGFVSDCYRSLNKMWKLEGTPYELDPNREYPYEELIDIRLRSLLGQTKGLHWLLRDEGGLLVWQAKPEELYKGAYREGRLHLYYEFMITAGREVDKITRESGLKWDTSDYQAIPDWKPCSSYLKKSGEYDLFVTNFKVPMQAHGVGRFNPLLRNLVDYHGYDFVLMNPITAAKKRIRHGDKIIIESLKGRKVEAIVNLSDRVHPEVIATMQHKLSKGADFNTLLTLDEETMDFVGCAVDSCVLARVQKSN